MHCDRDLCIVATRGWMVMWHGFYTTNDDTRTLSAKLIFEDSNDFSFKPLGKIVVE